MESLILSAITLFPMVAVVNWLVSLVKMAYQHTPTRGWLRFFLVLFSLLGVLASNALWGTEIDVNQVSDLLRMAVETLVLALSAHASYKVIKNA